MYIKEATVTFDIPTHWLHGAGYAKQVGEILKIKKAERPLVITDKNLYELGTVKTVTDALEAANLKYEICTEAQTEPCVKDFNALAASLDLNRFLKPCTYGIPNLAIKMLWKRAAPVWKPF